MDQLIATAHTTGPKGRLASMMESPRESWGVDEIVDFARRESIRALHLMHVGGDGWLKSLDFSLHSGAPC
jgi:hypothetical protein